MCMRLQIAGASGDSHRNGRPRVCTFPKSFLVGSKNSGFGRISISNSSAILVLQALEVWYDATLLRPPGALSMAKIQPSSMHDVGREAVLRHKWIESEKAGRDLGEQAIYDWIRRHWQAFYRARAFEHLLGTRRWLEMDPDEFGTLFAELAKQPGLAWPILEQFLNGADNLNMLSWATGENIPRDFVYRAISITNPYRYTGWSTIAFAEYVVENSR